MNKKALISHKFLISNEEQMIAFGSTLAKVSQRLKPLGCTIFLEGDLGAGKTTLVRGFIRAFGHQGAVKSPTYTLVEPYDFEHVKVYHFDLYRVSDPEECDQMGIRDYFVDNAYCLIEWPEKGALYLPLPWCTIKIETSFLSTGRDVSVMTASQEGPQLIEALTECL